MRLKMMQLFNNNPAALKVLLLCAMLGLGACQPKEKQEKGSSNESTASAENHNTLITAETVELKPQQPRTCDEATCTDYSFQTVKSNHAWINDYFKQRIIKSNPLAFESNSNTKDLASAEENPQKVNKTEIIVRYIGQNENLASFSMLSYIYTAGSAHGMYHNEYINFDLKQKKRIALEDLLLEGVESQLKDQLYAANSHWLSEHNIEKAKLNISDNFYYAANGIVFVYPLYELASYAEGMSELTLAYNSAQKLIKAEYLPNLPKYSEE